ncbi:unnamed protein product [Caenorhabditis bovis]|uniref:Uncharacterized protein n=1 Tax=Caenorhabditis bovis TaxID=2654633 RepID=A0A8S1EV40_9PELO|nr:unnamed protein product [Caenorhabditis bovis]
MLEDIPRYSLRNMHYRIISCIRHLENMECQALGNPEEQLQKTSTSIQQHLRGMARTTAILVSKYGMIDL